MIVARFLRWFDAQSVSVEPLITILVVHYLAFGYHQSLQWSWSTKKRHGAPYNKSVIFHSQPTIALCPVLAFKCYLTRLAGGPCMRSHPYRPQSTFNNLVRDIRSHTLSVGLECIRNHIKSLMQYFSLNVQSWSRQQVIPKTRALGPTLAIIQNGASPEDAVLHGAWSSPSVFEAFYRLLSRGPVSDLIALTLSG
ncbi:hypothetical protein [Parasitella parasitica]|uniref:Ndc10 domain-containing protein n=1 Tax=Parasitella parasitica TaxID=35722 RepID=A0A0B7MZZ9_9FUNG|nr:hypothetical protein [Parasitella parasitica]